jgi:hypothetical protein
MTERPAPSPEYSASHMFRSAAEGHSEEVNVVPP